MRMELLTEEDIFIYKRRAVYLPRLPDTFEFLHSFGGVFGVLDYLACVDEPERIIFEG